MLHLNCAKKSFYKEIMDGNIVIKSTSKKLEDQQLVIQDVMCDVCNYYQSSIIIFLQTISL